MKQKVDHDGLPGRGIMYLLDYNGRQIRRTHYSGKKERDLHIEEWRRQYAKAFNDCSIQIAPGFKLDNVDENGYNTRLPYKEPNKKR